MLNVRPGWSFLPPNFGFFSTETVKTLDASQQVALEQPVPQDSCGFLDGANERQKRTRLR